MNNKNLQPLFNRNKIPFTPILMHFAAKNAGFNYAQFASDYNVLVKSNLKALSDFEVDMLWLISDPYRETSAFGAPIEYKENEVPRCMKKIIQNNEDIKYLKIPDVYKSERTLDRINAAKVLRNQVKDIPLIGWIEGPLAEAATLTGVSEILMLLLTDPDFCCFLMDKCLELAKNFAKAQILNGCDIIGIGDAICSQIDVDTYSRLVKNRHKELFDFIHDQGASVKLHICGNISHLLPEMKDLGVDILDLDWQVDVQKAKTLFPSDTIFCGNINPIIIQNETPEQIEKHCLSIMNIMKNNYFILSGGCEITVNTPSENLKAMKKTCQQAGQLIFQKGAHFLLIAGNSL